MTDQYSVPNDITLEQKIEYWVSSLQPQLHDRWHFSKSIAVMQALEATYTDDSDKVLKEASDAGIKDLRKKLVRAELLIKMFQDELEPLLAEQKKRDEEAAQELAAQKAATEAAAITAPQIAAENGHIQADDLS